MAIKFRNIRNGDERVVTTEPHMAALLNSSNLGPNSHEGQDFGWRLAPEIVKRMRDIRGDQGKINTIASTFNVTLDDVKDSHILHWISLEDARKEAQTGQSREGEYTRKYEDELRALDEPVQEPASVPTVSTTPVPADKPQKASGK